MTCVVMMPIALFTIDFINIAAPAVAVICLLLIIYIAVNADATYCSVLADLVAARALNVDVDEAKTL